MNFIIITSLSFSILKNYYQKTKLDFLKRVEFKLKTILY